MKTTQNRRTGKWLIAAAMLATLSVRSDYLSELGAPALRWKPNGAPKFDALRTLPPLDMGHPAPATNAVSTVATNPPPPAPGEFYGPFPEEATAAGARAPGLPYQLDGSISPEWLSTMFYSPRTNGFGTLVLPAPFVPPAPPMRPSSATYTRSTP